jgi:hypothetical protein
MITKAKRHIMVKQVIHRSRRCRIKFSSEVLETSRPALSQIWVGVWMPRVWIIISSKTTWGTVYWLIRHAVALRLGNPICVTRETTAFFLSLFNHKWACHNLTSNVTCLPGNHEMSRRTCQGYQTFFTVAMRWDYMSLWNSATNRTTDRTSWWVAGTPASY